MQNTISVIMTVIKIKTSALYMMMSLRKELYVLLKYEIKIRALYSSYKKTGVVSKISIRCKALDVSPMAHVFSLIQ